MRILVIGGNGFIGPFVTDQLVNSGHRIAVLSRSGSGLGADTLAIRGDRNNLESSIHEIEQFRPDLVIDLILYTEKQANEFVRLFRGLAKRVVVISSSDVYRNYDGLRRKSDHQPDTTPLDEDSPLRETRYPYRGAGLDIEWADDYDKILVEEIVRDSKELPATILRLPAVYGRGDRQGRVQEYLEKMDTGADEIELDELHATWKWTRGYVRNVADAICLAAEQEDSPGNVYNIGDEPTLTERQWIEAIATAAGWNGEITQSIPDQTLDFRYHLETDCSRFREEFNYSQSYTLKESLIRTIDWERSQV